MKTMIVAFFADRREVEQVTNVVIPDTVPVAKRLFVAGLLIRRNFPDAYKFTEVKMGLREIAVECGAIPEGYSTAAAGY